MAYFLTTVCTINTSASRKNFEKFLGIKVKTGRPRKMSDCQDRKLKVISHENKKCMTVQMDRNRRQCL